MRVLELFCGSGTISRAFEERNHAAVSVDLRSRKGKCEPIMRLDVMKIKNPKLLFGKVDAVFASPPCQCWSYAAGSYHFFEGKPQTESTRYLMKVLEKTLWIIEEMSPVLYFIENPRGKLRYYKSMIDFLIRTNGMIKQVAYSQYGFPSPKPTNIFTNCSALTLKSIAPFGRGAKNYTGNLNNMTVHARQSIPSALAKEIVLAAEKYLEEIKKP